VKNFLSNASHVLGETQVWRFHEGKNGAWHLFRPSQEDEGCPCLHCPEGPGRARWADCPAHQERCSHCGFLRKDAHEVKWTGVEVHLRAKLTTEAGCRDLLDAWRCEERWRKKRPDEVPKVQLEFCDGRRFRERAAFFSPEASWQLPLECPNCSEPKPVYCSQKLSLPFHIQATEDMWTPETGLFETTCPRCLGEITATREQLRVRGTPLNQGVAYHMDGFPITSTTGKSAAVIDAVPLTASKRVRAHLTEGSVWPLSFSTKKHMKPGPDSYDPFMLIMVLEQIELFMRGVEVAYALDSAEVSDLLPSRARGSKVRVRVLPFCVFADYPALGEMCKFKRGGHHGSRRCNLRALRLEGELVYGDARLVVRKGCVPKRAEAVMEAGERHLSAGRGPDGTERKAIGHETGCTGFCILQLWSGMCGFHVVHDVHGDFLRLGPENQVKHFLHDFFRRQTSKSGGALGTGGAAACGRGRIRQAARMHQIDAKTGGWQVAKGPQGAASWLVESGRASESGGVLLPNGVQRGRAWGRGLRCGGARRPRPPGRLLAGNSLRMDRRVAGHLQAALLSQVHPL
jgi:hypothetical protein